MLKKITLSVTVISILIISSMTLVSCQGIPGSTVSAVEPTLYVSDDALTYRWQAMAAFYEKADMFTRDDFNYEQAAEVQALRWQAMAKFYRDNNLLTRDNFDYEQAAEIQAQRWVAMARFYEQAGMLTR